MSQVTQVDLITGTAVRVVKQGGGLRVEVARILNDALQVDLVEHAGQVFHRTKTPRASARRAMYEAIEENVLFIKDGRGFIRIRKEGLRDVIIQGDIFEVIALLEDESVDMVCADPAWTYMDKHIAVGAHTRMTIQSHYECRNPDEGFFRHVERILKPGRYACMYLPPFQEESADTWLQVLHAAKDAGLVPLREVTWKKQRGMGYRWTGTSEPILCWYKPGKGGKKPECGDRKATNFIEATAPRNGERTPFTDYGPEDWDELQALIAEHGKTKLIPKQQRINLKGRYLNTEKPLEVARHLFRVAAVRDGVVVDAWAGSAGVSVVAKEHGMHFIAIEGSPRHVWHLAAPRLREHVQTIIEVQA